jgi:hypothetical protein
MDDIHPSIYTVCLFVCLRRGHDSMRNLFGGGLARSGKMVATVQQDRF